MNAGATQERLYSRQAKHGGHFVTAEDLEPGDVFLTGALYDDSPQVVVEHKVDRRGARPVVIFKADGDIASRWMEAGQVVLLLPKEQP